MLVIDSDLVKFTAGVREACVLRWIIQRKDIERPVWRWPVMTLERGLEGVYVAQVYFVLYLLSGRRVSGNQCICVSTFRRKETPAEKLSTVQTG